VPGRQQAVGEMRSDKPGSPGDYDTQLG
jgi:hypothetical protein